MTRRKPQSGAKRRKRSRRDPRWRGRAGDPPPRRIRNGIELTISIDGLQDDSRSRGWMRIAEVLAAGSLFDEAVEYAKKGQVVSLDLQPGRAAVLVQGIRQRPHSVEIHVPRFSDLQWRNVVATLSEDVGLAAHLLASELTARMIGELARAGSDLVPSPEEVKATCDCGDELSCVHRVTAVLLLAQHCHRRPDDLLVLRGLSKPALLERMRQHRVLEMRGNVGAHPEQRLAQLHAPDLPLESLVDSFWSLRRAPAMNEPEESSRPVSHALLRRMGPSPIPGSFPIVGLLASVYDEVSSQVRSLSERLERSAPDQDETTP